MPSVRPLMHIALLAVLLAVGMPSDQAQAFRLVPIEMEFTPSGRGATQIFRVENEGDEPVALEIRVEKRAMDRDGQDVLTEAYDDWVVFPEQIILQPKETQSVRVQYIGDAALDREAPYRLIAEQLPIDIGQAPSQGGQVRLLVRYVASLYVMPEGVAPDVVVDSAALAKLPDGTPALELVLTNRGTSRQMLREPVVTLGTAGGTLDLSGEQLTGLVGENVLAGTTRRFLVPAPAGLAQAPVSVDIRLP